MGGDVMRAWTIPGKGSCFQLSLPSVPVEVCDLAVNLAVVQPRPCITTAQAAAPLCGRVLLAEDGPDNQRLISFYLRKAGADVTIADNGRIVLEMIETAAAVRQPLSSAAD